MSRLGSVGGANQKGNYLAAVKYPSGLLMKLRN